MNWSLINEFGSTESPCRSNDVEHPLHFPTFAACCPDGGYLIGDELGKEKLVPFRFESRMIRSDISGNITLDSVAMGIPDGFGCLDDDGCLAILCRTRWELLLLSTQGKVVNRLPLSTMSKRLPRHVSGTERGTFLVSFFNRAGEIDLIEVDRRGRLCWFLERQPDCIGVAGSIQATSAGTILIADPIRHVAIEIDREGDIIWQFGEVDHPAADLHHLSSPNSVRTLPGGYRLIADTRNHRVLRVDPEGDAEPLEVRDSGLCDPMYADGTEDGGHLVCDSGNRRVIRVDSSGTIVWQCGDSPGNGQLFSYPRSVDISKSGGYLVADTAHDRIVEVADGQVNEKPFHGSKPLFWPRCARLLPSEGIIVADGRNGRVIEFGEDGQPRNELSRIDHDGPRNLGDPHDVHLLPNGNLLIADSMHDLVVEVDWSGHVHRAVGGPATIELSDPHSAQQLSDGSLVIADTGNHRLLFIAPDGACLRTITAIKADDCCYRLNFPRYAEVADDGTMVIADTGNNRILAATIDGQFLWEFSRVPDSPCALLNQPRWAKLINRREVVICDHFHHRILHVRRTGPEPPSDRCGD